MDPAQITLQDDARALTGRAFRFGNRAVYQGVSEDGHIWSLGITIGPDDDIEVVETDESGEKVPRRLPVGELFEALEIHAPDGPAAFAVVASLALAGLDLRGVDEPRSRAFGVLLQRAADDPNWALSVKIGGEPRTLHLSDQGRGMLRHLAAMLDVGGRAMTTMPAARQLDISDEMLDMMGKRIRRPGLQAYRVNGRWYAVRENLSPRRAEPRGEIPETTAAAPPDESPASSTSASEHSAPAADLADQAQANDAAAGATSSPEPQPMSQTTMTHAAVDPETSHAIPDEPSDVLERPDLAGESQTASMNGSHHVSTVERSADAEAALSSGYASMPGEAETAAEIESDQESTITDAPALESLTDEARPSPSAGGAETGPTGDTLAMDDGAEVVQADAAPEANGRSTQDNLRPLTAGDVRERSAARGSGPALSVWSEVGTTRQARTGSSDELVDQLRQEIDFLRRQLSEKDRQIAAWVDEGQRKNLVISRFEGRVLELPQMAVSAEPGAGVRAQLEAIREEWLQPLIDQIRALENQVGHLEAERAERQASDLEAIRQERDLLRSQVEALSGEVTGLRGAARGAGPRVPWYRRLFRS
jgi:hypothetical protein